MAYNFIYKSAINRGHEENGTISFLPNDRIQTEDGINTKIFSVSDINSIVFVSPTAGIVSDSAYLFFDLEGEEYTHQLDAICESFQNSENHAFCRFVKDFAVKYPNFELKSNGVNGYTLVKNKDNNIEIVQGLPSDVGKLTDSQFYLKSFDRSFKYMDESIYHLITLFRPMVYLSSLFILMGGLETIIPALIFIFLPNIMIAAANHSVPHILNEGTLKINKNGIIEINKAVIKEQIRINHISEMRLDYPRYPLRPCYVLTVRGDFKDTHEVKVVSPGNHEPHNTLEEFAEAFLSNTDSFVIEKDRRRLICTEKKYSRLFDQA